MNLVAPDEHQLLVFWTQLLVLLLVARVLGQVMRRVGQPAVVGQLGAGLVLGPSVLGQIAPGAVEWLFPRDDLQSGMLFAVSWIGVLLLLIETGFDTDLALIRRLGRATALVSAGSVLLPLLVGLVVGSLLPGVFQGPLDSSLVFTLFVAAALSISSLAVAGKVLSELGLMRRNFGQVTLAAGMANDVVGWIMLGVVASLAAAGRIAPGSLAVTVIGIGVLYIGGLTVGQRAVDAVLRQLLQRDIGVTGYLTAVIGIALVFGVATQLIGAEAVLGAFVAGILIGRSKFQQPEARHGLETVTAGVFAPIFFATAGLRVDLSLLGRPEIWRWTLLVVLAASISKFVGAYIGSRLADLHPREGVLLGLGLNPRGTLEIVIATVGLSLGVFNEASYTVILVMTISLSMAAPPLLRAVARSWQGTDEEQRRLQREESMSRNLVVRGERLLLPSKGGPNSIVAAQVLHLTWPEEVRATILSVGDQADTSGIEAMMAVLDDRPVDLVDIDSGEASAEILREARLGYGAIGVGAPDAATGPWILSPIVDDLLSSTAIPIVIVRRARNLDRPLPGAFARAIVPVSPDHASRGAQEVAFNLSARIGTEIVLQHVVDAGVGDDRSRSLFGRHPRGTGTLLGGTGRRAGADSQIDVADRVLERARAYAGELDARARTKVSEAASPADAIVAATHEEEADLVVMGASLRRIEGRPFLGHVVEQVLEECDSTVVVVATPSGDVD